MFESYFFECPGISNYIIDANSLFTMYNTASIYINGHWVKPNPNAVAVFFRIQRRRPNDCT